MKSKLTKWQQCEIKLNSQAIHIVYDAIKLIEKGWTKKRYAGISVPKKRKVYNVDFAHPRANVFCLVGALRRAQFILRYNNDAYQYAEKACELICTEILKTAGLPVGFYDANLQLNDRKQTKKSDIITALHGAHFLLAQRRGYTHLLTR